ncbi:MAG: helix-turn-helix domain-containing protein, partial [Microcystaceae cyanobacterium]
KLTKLAGDRQVKLAQEFMLANLEKPISLGDEAAAIGVSGRSLQRAFAKYCGCSPLQFLRQARLEALREELKTAMASDLGITDAMIKYQFSNLGRCSQQYKERFGELPSETLTPTLRR